MVLPNPASPATTMPETSAERMKTGLASSAQPNHHESRVAGAMPDRSTRAGAKQRIAVQPAQPDQARGLLLGPDTDAAPGVGQVAGGALVVGQTSPGDGGHRRGDALVVGDELGHGEAVLAGPLIPVAEAQGLGEQGPLGRQPPRLPGRWRAAVRAGCRRAWRARSHRPSRCPARTSTPPTRTTSSHRPTKPDQAGQRQSGRISGSTAVGGGG